MCSSAQELDTAVEPYHEVRTHPFMLARTKVCLSSMTNTQLVESETHQSTTEDNYPRVSSGDTDRSPTREEDIIINRGGESLERATTFAMTLVRRRAKDTVLFSSIQYEYGLRKHS